MSFEAALGEVNSCSAFSLHAHHLHLLVTLCKLLLRARTTHMDVSKGNGWEQGRRLAGQKKWKVGGGGGDSIQAAVIIASGWFAFLWYFL